MAKLGIAILPLLIPPVQLLLNDISGRDEIPAVQAVVVMCALALITFARTARLLHSESRVRAELASARDAALEGSRAKSAFLATMSHEIRTPMNGVIGLTGLMLETELDVRQRQYAEGVRTAGNALLTVINDVLDFSKIEAGHLDLEVIDLDLVQVVEEVAELVTEPARAKSLELLAYCSPELPGRAPRRPGATAAGAAQPDRQRREVHVHGRGGGPSRASSPPPWTAPWSASRSPTPASGSPTRTSATCSTRSPRPTRPPPGSTAAPASGWRSATSS